MLRDPGAAEVLLDELTIQAQPHLLFSGHVLQTLMEVLMALFQTLLQYGHRISMPFKISFWLCHCSSTCSIHYHATIDTKFLYTQKYASKKLLYECPLHTEKKTRN